ncbi:hypothetical protein [Oscillatoria acuminata]|nr:hypothetical protein [Oscillatoria acuminata]
MTQQLKIHRMGIVQGDRDLGIKLALAKISGWAFSCAPDIPVIDAQSGS